jgi:uncharacterized membrane protein HdeD (DUF308 family)
MSTPGPGPGLPSLPSPMSPMFGVIQENLGRLRHSWFWFVLLGFLLMVLGMGAISYSALVSVVAVWVFGWFLLAGGVFYIVGAFFTGAWGGFFLSLLAGVLYLATGFIVLEHPGEAAILYTLLLAVFFFVEGLFRIFAALSGRFRHRGWVLFNGVVTLLLGFMIWQAWPLSGLWVIGFFVGIDLIMSGVGYLMLGLSCRQIPVQ